MITEETLRTIAFDLARFAGFAANALIFGFVPILLFILRPSFVPLPGDGAWHAGRRRLADRLEGLLQAGLVASAVATGTILLLQAILTSEFLERDLGWDVFSSVFETPFGRWNLVRFPILIALAVLLLGKVRQWSLAGAGDEKRSPRASWWLIWAFLGIGLLATTTFSGHATVASPVWLAVTNDVIHLVAGAAWFSGIVLMAIALPDGWRGQAPVERLRLLAPVVIRFSRLGFVAIGVVVVTGVINSFLHVGAANDLVDTGYGRALAVKILVFLLIIVTGGVNHYVLKPRMQRGLQDMEPSRAQLLFRKTIALELAVGLLLFGLTGVLIGLGRTA